MSASESSKEKFREELPFPGAVDHDGEVTFTIYAPGKQSVHLIGDFNDFDGQADPLEQVAEGLWSTTKQMQRGSYAYQFLIDGELIICDPYARYIEGDPGDRPRKAIVRPREEAYEWRHDGWSRTAFADLCIYEIHIADFTPQRDFREAVERLDYVRDLGVNAIELMPVFGVHENKGWGYAPTYLFAPNEDFGTPNELRWLIDEAHGKGLAVILDMVLAHTGHKHPFNEMYDYEHSPWYGTGPNGGNEFGLPQLDYSKHPTRQFVKDVLAYWLTDFHVDGFRFDYARSIGVTAEGHGVGTLTWAARDARPDAYCIGEYLPEDPAVMMMAEMDGAWHVRFSYAMKALLCQCENHGYSWDDFEKAIRTLDAGAEGYGNRPTVMVNYLESHDEQRVMLDIINAGFDVETARRKSALGATVLLTAVGEPMLYHGQVWGQDAPINMDHNFIDWDELNTPGGQGLCEHYRRMIGYRRDHAALRTAHLAIDAVWPEQKCVAYHRWNEAGEEIVVAANFSGEVQKLAVPLPRGGRWRELFSGDEGEWPKPVERSIEAYAAQVFERA